MEAHNTRDEIIHRAVLEKLSEGINFFSADDILAVAGIDEVRLKQISESIKNETRKTREGKKQPVTKRKRK